MKRSMTIYFISLICTISCYAQIWKKIEPTFNPSGNYNMSLGTFIDKDIGWFTETFPGRTWRTQDGGITWEKQIDSSSVWSYNIEFVDSKHGWIVGKQIGDSVQFIKRTKDSGKNWELFTFPEEIVAITFFDSLNGLIGGLNTIFNTDDGGDSWSEQNIDREVEEILSGDTIRYDAAFTIFDMFFLCKQNGWAVGHRNDVTDCGIILNTNDGGEFWHIKVSVTSMLESIYFSNNQCGCAVGSNVFREGVILVTNDGGKNWKDIYLPCPRLNDVIFTDDSTGWVVGDCGFIWHTTNGGQTWTQVESGTDADLNRIVFVDNGNIGYIFGEDNTLLKYNKSGTNIIDSSNSPCQFSLSQNYPNPFNASTTIKYSIEITSNIIINVYDLLGKEVVMLYKGKISSGSHKIVWNSKDKLGNEVCSGIYFFVLQSGGARLTHKMILLR